MGLRARVELVDVGVGGAAIRTKRRLNVGDEGTLTFDLDGKWITIKGVVVWSQSGGSRPGTLKDAAEFTAGIKFTGTLTSDFRALAHLIDQYKVAEERRISGLRFRLRDPHRAVLESLAIYRVRLISLSGMLIEAERPLDLDEVYAMEILPSGQEPIAFSGRVRSCLEVRGESPLRYEIGVEFIEIPPEFRDRLNRFVEWLATK